jgi:hypothetical protein
LFAPFLNLIYFFLFSFSPLLLLRIPIVLAIPVRICATRFFCTCRYYVNTHEQPPSSSWVHPLGPSGSLALPPGPPPSFSPPSDGPSLREAYQEGPGPDFNGPPQGNDGHSQEQNSRGARPIRCFSVFEAEIPITQGCSGEASSGRLWLPSKLGRKSRDLV